jgi:hypothetical protein
MTAARKQDSNFTGLRFAVETTPGVVDGSAVWYPLEPNSYKGFGGEVKLKARQPINSSRQLKKGVVVDVDASGGFNQDLTQTNFQRLSEFFFFSALRTKSELSIATVDGTGNAYQPASGGTGYYAGDLLFAKDLTAAANDGLKVVTGLPTATNIAVTDTGLLDGAAQSGTISRVGFKFGSGDVEIDVSGDLPRLKSVSSQVAASGTLTNDGTNVTDGDTVTIGGKVYTFESSLTNVDGHVKIGASNTATMTNLFHAINASGGTVGTDYATLTTATPAVTATNPTGTTVVVTARVTGTAGNAITTTEASSHLSWGGATLASGAGARGFDSFGLIPGEFVFIGGDGTNEAFATAACNGFCRIRAVAADGLDFDKTQSTMVADNGSGKTIALFFGRVIKNESDPTLILKRSVQLERTLGTPDEAIPSQIQAQYLRRGIADTVKVDCKTADIVKLDLDFMCNDEELKTGAEGVKAGTRPTLVDSDAFNSTSDVAFTKLAIVTAGEAAPSALFSYFTDLQIELKNNVKQNKAVSVLGAFDSTAGFFEVTANLTAYFTNVSEIQAVKDNATITLETHFVKANAGITVDLPVLALSKALPDVKINEPIMIPLEAPAATGAFIDAALDHTMLWVFWDYLPDLAG